MSATFDATTTAAYAAANTAAERSALIVAALTGTISVKVFDGTNTEMGSGTMDSPWATASGDTVTVGEVTSFTVGTTATPDADWYIRFQNAGATRWVRGSFGLSSSSQDFTWSLSTWTATHTGTIGTATIITSGNTAPVFTVAPTTASITETGGTIQFTATDADSDTIIYSLTTTRSGITINSSTGLVTVTAAAAGTSGNIVVSASDGIIATTATCSVTVTSSSSEVANFIIPSNVSTWDASSARPRVSGGTAIPNTIANVIIELSAGTSYTAATAGTRGKLTISNLHPTTGTATVRNPSAGKVTIQGGSFTLLIDGGPERVVVDGTNGGETYGIVVKAPSANSYSGSLVKFKGVWSDITLKGIEVDGRWSTFTGTGSIGIAVNDQAQTWGDDVWDDGLRITQCYVHNVNGEGMYIGPNFSSGEPPLRNVEIDHCFVEQTGRDGLNGKNWWSGSNSVHHNTFTNVGLNTPDEDGQREAITITGGPGRIYNNVIQHVGERGIVCASNNGPPVNSTAFADGTYGPYASFDVEIFNNLIVDCGTVAGLTGAGIQISGDVGTVLTVPKIYNNTVVDCEGAGVNITRSVGGWIRNNVLIGNGSTYDLGSGGATQRDNKTTGTLTASYRLASEDAAVGTPGTDISLTDLDDVSRSGTASKGAYEYT